MMSAVTRRFMLITSGCSLAALAWWAGVTTRPSRPPAPSAGGPITSLAVLPFGCTPADTLSQRALGVGVADQITTHLRQMPGIMVSPFSEVLQVPHQDADDPRRAGERLGAKTVLSGRCAITASAVSLKVSLTETAGGRVLWEGESSTAMPVEATEAERSLAAAVLRHLAPGVPPPRGDGAPLARFLCVLARAKTATYTSDAPLRALALLEKAVEHHPDLAEGHTEIAAASVDMFLSGQSASPAWMARAVAAARRGVRLSPGSAHAHFVLGRALFAGGEPVEATRATLEAIRLDPSLGQAHMQLAGILAGAGPVEAARTAVARAMRLDPDGGAGWVDSYLAQLEGRTDAQIALLREEYEIRRAARKSVEQHALLLAYMHAWAGHSAEALSWLASLEGVSRNDPLVDLIRMRVMGEMGRREAVRRLLEDHRAFYERDWQYSIWIAEILALSGEPEEAIAWIQKAVDLGSVDAWGVETMEGLAPLHRDPRLDKAARTLRRRADAVVEMVEKKGYS